MQNLPNNIVFTLSSLMAFIIEISGALVNKIAINTTGFPSYTVYARYTHSVGREICTVSD